jgi:hypothetical protein
MRHGIFLFTLFLPLLGFAWGNRGHHTVCESAVYLVKEKPLREFLQEHVHFMGHLCNVPDIYWKSIGTEASQAGNSAHYIDYDILGISFQEIPSNYQTIVDQYTGKNSAYDGKKIFSVPSEFGSNWWRADQFHRRAVAAGKLLKDLSPPSNRSEEQDNNLPYNKNVYDFYVNLGLMGHFAGDNAQPFHLSADYDGYKTGHGGIHSYYEEAVVDALPYNLAAKVVEEGRRLQKLAESKNLSNLKRVGFLTSQTVVEKMKALGEISYSEISKVLSLDQVKKPSSIKDEKGMSLKVRAERDPAEKTAPKFEKMVVQQMGRSASLLASLWDQAYVDAGKPDLKGYKSFLYPFTPDFVPPDYYEIKKEAPKEK